MSDRSGRPQQPFQFWFPYWRNQSQRPVRLPAQRPPPPPPPHQTPEAPPSRVETPPAPSQAPPIPPSPSPIRSPSPSTRRTPKPPSPSPSPSRRLSQPIQSPLPSRGSSRPSLPSRVDTSKKQAETSKGSRSPSPSQPPPPLPSSQIETATVNNVPPQPPLPSPVISPPQDQLETTSPQTEDTILSQPVSKPTTQAAVSPPQDQLETTSPQTEGTILSQPVSNQPEEEREPKPMSSDSLEKETPGSIEPKKSVPREIAEERPEPKPQTEQQIDPLTQPEFEGKTAQTIEEKPKIHSELETKITPRKRVSEEVQVKDKPKMKPETQKSDKPQIAESTELEKIIKPKESTEEIDTTTAVSHPGRSELITDMRISTGKQFKEEAGPKEKESKISIASVPSASFPGGERATFQSEIKEGISKLVQKLKVAGQHHQLGNGNGVTIITLAGENKGATMVIGHDAMNDEGFSNNHRQYKLNEDRTRATHNADSSHSAGERPEVNASINSNVQSINNSLLQESSCSEKDPGVHWAYSSTPIDAIKLKGRLDQPATFKTAASNVSAQKLTYEPNIRRRCLRGLFLESSDDQDNPQKPRRHGCKFRCDKKNAEG